MLELIIFIRDIRAMALSHLIVLNNPLEDIGAYAFQRKLDYASPMVRLWYKSF